MAAQAVTQNPAYRSASHFHFSMITSWLWAGCDQRLPVSAHRFLKIRRGWQSSVAIHSEILSSISCFG